MILTYHYRIKDANKISLLRRLAGNCNFVWNFANEVIRRRWQESRFYTNRTYLDSLLKGSSKLLEINSQTIQAVAHEVLLRVQKTKKRIRFRSRKKNLGWIPFQGQTFKFHGGYCDYNGVRFRLWQHRPLPAGAAIKCGSFCEDAQGRWYLNLCCEVPEQAGASAPAGSSVGIDPGLKTILTTSDGEKFDRENLTRKYAPKLGAAQRRRKKRQVKKLHSKIKNCRKDFSHKVTTKLATTYRTIFFGDVKSRKLAKTKLAKSTYDAGWYQIKQFLHYKAIRHGGTFMEINENNSTITCSNCLSKTGPSGLSGLRVREWTCGVCKTVHDRDVNSARNILRRGHATLRAPLKKRA